MLSVISDWFKYEVLHKDFIMITGGLGTIDNR